jgi:hypothetical protein
MTKSFGAPGWLARHNEGPFMVNAMQSWTRRIAANKKKPAFFIKITLKTLI